MDIWLASFNSYDKKTRTADNSDFNSDFNPDFPYEIELRLRSETMDVLKEDRKDLAA
jgi:hypothetical protein